MTMQANDQIVTVERQGASWPVSVATAMVQLWPLEVPPMLYRDLAAGVPEDASAQLQARVNTTRTLQQRYAAEGQFCNAPMLPEQLQACQGV
jgi:hypothetical protein